MGWGGVGAEKRESKSVVELESESGMKQSKRKNIILILFEKCAVITRYHITNEYASHESQ